MDARERVRSLDKQIFGPPTNKPSRLEPYWERPWGWLVPGGIPWKLGRRDGRAGRDRASLTVLLVFDVWSVRTYDRGRARSIADGENG
jgi:hypothetical protein